MDKRMTKDEFWETLMGILYEQKCAWTSEYQREIDEKTEDIMSYIKSLEENDTRMKDRIKDLDHQIETLEQWMEDIRPK